MNEEECVKSRYSLLKHLIIRFYRERPTEIALKDYLLALERELKSKSTQQKRELIDLHLANALSNLPDIDPVKRRLRARYQKLVERVANPLVGQWIAQRMDFDALLVRLGELRGSIAEQVCDLPTSKFGELRQLRARTPVVKKGRYEDYLPKILSLVPEGKRAHQLSYSLEGITISLKDIPLSSLIVCRSPPRDQWLFGEFVRKEMEYPVASIVHTDPIYLTSLKKYCRGLYQDLLVKPRMEKIAKMHWCMAHAMFFSRGSAAITEWMIRGLVGCKIEWKKPPDLEAICEPNCMLYVQNYALNLCNNPSF